MFLRNVYKVFLLLYIMNKRVGLLLAGLIVGVFLVVPVSALIELGEGGFLEQVEPILEVINLFIAVIAIFLAVSVIPLLTGELKKVWIYLTIAVALFGLFEIFGVLKILDIFKYHGLGDLIEFFFVGMILIAVYKMQTIFKKLSSEAKSKPKE